MSHEDWSCPWTGEVIEQSLFGEEVGCAACCSQWDGSDHANLTPRTTSPEATRTGHGITPSPKRRTRGVTRRRISTDGRASETRTHLWKCATSALVSLLPFILLLLFLLLRLLPFILRLLLLG